MAAAAPPLLLRGRGGSRGGGGGGGDNGTRRRSERCRSGSHIFFSFQSSLVARKPNCLQWMVVRKREREGQRMRGMQGEREEKTKGSFEREGRPRRAIDRRGTRKKKRLSLSRLFKPFLRTSKFLMIKKIAPVAERNRSSNSSPRAKEESERKRER